MEGMKSAYETADIVRHRDSTHARQPDQYLDGQPGSSRTPSLSAKRLSNTLGKTPGTQYVSTSSKETPRAVASYPRPQQNTGEQPDFLASRGTFDQAVPQGDPLLDKFLSGSQGSQNATFPLEANNGDEPQEIQEVGIPLQLL